MWESLLTSLRRDTHFSPFDELCSQADSAGSIPVTRSTVNTLALTGFLTLYRCPLRTLVHRCIWHETGTS